MPKALVNFLGYSFFFWSDEQGEPLHVHVCKGNPSPNATKFWVTKDGVKLVHNKSRIPKKDLQKLSRYIMQNRAVIIATWFDYFGSF